MVTIFARTIIIYLLLMCAMRLTGKRQIGELELSDLVITFLISEIASLPITDNLIPLSHAVIPIITLVAFEVLTSFLVVHFPAFKNIVSARPTVLINKGKTDRRAMLAARISVDELISEMRQKGITDISEVEYAILEQNGKLTVIQKAPYKQPTVADLNIKNAEAGISHIVVCEGRINKNGLKILSMTKKEIMTELARQGVALKDVYVMLIDDAKKVQIIKKEGNL